MFYLYALVLAPWAADLSLRGWHDAPLVYRTVGAHTAVLSTCDTPPPPTIENLWAHEQLVEQLLTQGSALPVRFGSCLPDNTAVDEMLTQNQDRFQQAFARVAGHVELSVRILWEPPEITLPPLSKESGAAYLRSKLAIEQATRPRAEQGNAFCTAVQTPLYPLSTAHTEQIDPARTNLLTAAYLVKKENVAQFQETIRQLNQAHPQLEIICTGPWPPYNFV